MDRFRLLNKATKAGRRRAQIENYHCYFHLLQYACLSYAYLLFDRETQSTRKNVHTSRCKMCMQNNRSLGVQKVVCSANESAHSMCHEKATNFRILLSLPRLYVAIHRHKRCVCGDGGPNRHVGHPAGSRPSKPSSRACTNTSAGSSRMAVRKTNHAKLRFDGFP